MKRLIFGLSALALFLAGCNKSPATSGAHESIAVTDSTFESVVLKSDVPVLIDFSATWCGPCQAIAPAVEEVAAEFKGRAKVAKVDVDESPETAKKFGVEGIPLLIVLKNGKEVARQEGVDGTRDYKEQVASLLKSAL